MPDLPRPEVIMAALRMAVAWAACPAERCEYVVKDCVDCKVRIWLAEAERVLREGERRDG